MELIGRQFGHIRVTEVVGEGGMGAVYAGYDEKLDRKVALKVLHADQRLDEEARERLLREARALSKVDHPNICRIHDYIETGGVDLLVLEYIDGRTLQRAIDDGLPQGEKLRIALAVAEVLVRAHRAGIVHRDLKPENVMLTKAGEVKVLDFGLARWLHRGRKSDSNPAASPPPVLRVREERPDPHLGDTVILPAARPSDIYPSGRREFLNTAVGIALGTPLYMSPEQARGEALTPASDMFAFGLLLQVLFTGKEPHPDLISAREVILRVARGETNPVDGAPKEIAALINSLKQFAPADRPTAVQAVERLRFLIETPQRVARRAIAAAVIAVMLIGGWRYTVDLQFERSRAVDAQREAERQRAKAEDMIEFMLGDLRKKLEPVGKLDVLDDVAQRALTYVDELKPETSSAEELARNSKALNQLVEVRVAQGNLKDALQLANRSMRLTYLAVEKAPSDPEVLLAHGTSHFWVGNVYRLVGDNTNALARWKSYLAISERLTKAHPNDETYQIERAYGHSNLATLAEASGDFTTALDHHRITLQVKSIRLMAKPDDPERQSDMAVTLNKMGWAQYRLGYLTEARDAFQRELATYEKLAASDPDNRTWRDRMSRSHGYVARAVTALGDVATAETHVRSELAVQSQLHDYDRANRNWHRNLAMAHSHLATLLRYQDRQDAAIAEATRGRALMSELIASDPERQAWRLERASVSITLARALLSSGRIGDAWAMLADARRDVELAKSNPFASLTAASADFIAGEIHRARGDAAAARESWTAAVNVFAAVPDQRLDPMLRATQVVVLLRLGRTAEAAPIIARLESAGYRHPEYLAERVVASGRM